LGAGNVVVLCPALEHVVRPGSLVGVTEGEKTQASVGGSHLEARVDGGELVEEVRMGEHRALGRSGRSRGVDDGSDVLGTAALEAGLQGGVVLRGSPALHEVA